MLRSHQSCSLVCLLTLLLMGEQLPWQLCALVFCRLRHGVWGNLLFALFCHICHKLELTFGQCFLNISRMGPLSIWVWAPQPFPWWEGFPMACGRSGGCSGVV